MNYLDYKAAVKLAAEDHGFRVLLGALMLKADTANTHRIIEAWPVEWAEFKARYDAPGGVLSTDPQALRDKILGPPRTHDHWVEAPCPRVEPEEFAGLVYGYVEDGGAVVDIRPCEVCYFGISEREYGVVQRVVANTYAERQPDADADEREEFV